MEGMRLSGHGGGGAGGERPKASMRREVGRVVVGVLLAGAGAAGMLLQLDPGRFGRDRYYESLAVLLLPIYVLSTYFAWLGKELFNNN